MVYSFFVFGCQYQCSGLPGKTRLSEMISYVSSGTLNPTHSLTDRRQEPIYFTVITITGKHHLSWLVPCLSKCSMCHRPLHSNQFHLVLVSPSSSSCTWYLLSTFLAPDLFPGCFLVALYLCGFAVFTEVLVCQCCHHFFSALSPSDVPFFFFAGPLRAHGQFSSSTLYWRFHLATFPRPVLYKELCIWQ